MTKIITLIPARAGSTRVPNKNLQLIRRKTLVQIAIEQSLKIKNNNVFVSTNCEKIESIAKKNGARVIIRDDSLCTPNATSISCILDFLSKETDINPTDLICFKPCTNPFLTHESFIGMVKLIRSKRNAVSVVSITEPSTHPFRLIDLRRSGYIQNAIFTLKGKNINNTERSQDWPQIYEGSPALRITKASHFQQILVKSDNLSQVRGKTYNTDRCLGYPISQLEAFDIDTQKDLQLSRKLCPNYI